MNTVAMRVPALDKGLIDEMLEQYIEKHHIDGFAQKEMIGNFLKNFLEDIGRQFDDPNVETLLSLSKECITYLRKKYDTFSNCCASRQYRDALLLKFQRHIYKVFENELSSVFMFFQTDQDSIDRLNGILKPRRVGYLKKQGIITISQLLSLTTDEFKLFWYQYSGTFKTVVRELHSAGYYFSDEATFSVVDCDGCEFTFLYYFKDSSYSLNRQMYNYEVLGELRYDEDDLLFKCEKIKPLRR